MSASENEPPQVKNQEGRWDERVAYAILVIPFVLVSVAVFAIVGLVATGVIPVNASIEGTLAATSVFESVVAPLMLVFGVLLALTWVLALMKVFGVNPVVWLVRRVANAAREYNPDGNS